MKKIRTIVFSFLTATLTLTGCSKEEKPLEFITDAPSEEPVEESIETIDYLAPFEYETTGDTVRLE